MEYKIWLPHPLLKPYIRYYTFMELGSKDTWSSSAIAPTGCTAVCVIVGGCLSFFKDHSGNVHRQHIINVTGQTTLYTPFSFYGQHKVISIIFNPCGAYRLLGVSQSNFTDANVVDFFELLPVKERAIQQQFLDCQKPEETFSLLQAFLLRLLLQKKEKNNYARIESICRLLNHRSHEPLLIKNICRDEGFSKSALERNFSEFVGIGVKQYHRIVRFNNLLLHVKQQKDFIHWTETAHRFGYYDQAHFIKDFKVFYGKTPSAFSTNDQLMSNMVQ